MSAPTRQQVHGAVILLGAVLLLVLFLRPHGLCGSREVGSQREF